MPVLDSAALIAVHYDDKRRQLRATFRPRARAYVYRDVPREVYDALLAAESRGAFFNAHIRDRYAFRELRR
jgi:lysyl-tRNA synthetase class 2